MQLPMRKIGTPFVPPALSDASIQQHRLVLLRLAYLVDRYDVPRLMVVSRDQSGLHLFPRQGIGRAEKGSQCVDGIGNDDKRMMTIDYSISAAGDVLPPQVIFEGLTERSLPSNAAEFIAKGWQLCYSANHWSSTSLAPQYVDVVEKHSEKVSVCVCVLAFVSPWTELKVCTVNCTCSGSGTLGFLFRMARMSLPGGFGYGRSGCPCPGSRLCCCQCCRCCCRCCCGCIFCLQERGRLQRPANHPGIIVQDKWKPQTCEAYRDDMNLHHKNVFTEYLWPHTTGKYEVVDLAGNASQKRGTTCAARRYVQETAREQLRSGVPPGSVNADLKMSTLKPRVLN